MREGFSAHPREGITLRFIRENQKSPKAEKAVPEKAVPENISFFQVMIPEKTCANPPRKIAMETIMDPTGYIPI